MTEATLCIVGLGLIGGSLAKAARAGGAVSRVVAVDPDREQIRAGLELGVIDAGGTDARDAGPPPADAAPEVEEESDVEPAPAPEPEPEEAEYPDDLILSDDDVLVDPDLDDVVESEEDLTVPDVVVTAPAIDETEQRPTGGAVQRLGEEELERFSYDNPDAVVCGVFMPAGRAVSGDVRGRVDGHGHQPEVPGLPEHHTHRRQRG